MSGQGGGGGPEPAPAAPGTEMPGTPAAPATPAAATPVAPAVPTAPGTDPDPRVAEVLQRLRSGVRQRQAEAATVGGLGTGDGSGSALGLSQGLLALKTHEYVQEPVPFSHRARLGKAVVWSRKAFFHLFLKWFIRPVLAQQNAFNQAAGRMLQELAEAQERTAREARMLAGRLAALEARADEAAAAAAAAAAGEGAAAEPAPQPREPGGEGEPRR